MNRTTMAVAAASLVYAWSMHAETIDPDITSNVWYDAGDHVISNLVQVRPGARLVISGANVRVISPVGLLQVEGTLHLMDTTIMGAGAGDSWGWIIGLPGSTVTCERSTFVHGGGHPDVPSGTNYVVLAEDARVQMNACVFDEPKAFSLECAGAAQFVSSGNVYAARNALAEWAHRSVSMAFRPGKRMEFDLQNDRLKHGTNGTHGYVISGVITEPVVLPALHDGAYYLSYDNYLLISNTTVEVQPGVTVRCLPGCGIHVQAGALLHAAGSTQQMVRFVHHTYAEGQSDTDYINDGWRGVVVTEGSTARLSHVYLRGASYEWCPSLTLRDSVLDMSDAIVRPGTYIAVIASNTSLAVYNSDIQYFHLNAIRAHDHSHVYVRDTVLTHIMSDGGNDYGVECDVSSSADARFCWWGSASGPRPYGTGEAVSSNVIAFPWLLAAPGSLTNPPEVQITSPVVEPYVTSDPQAWLEGLVHDDGQVVSVLVQNAASPHRVQVIPDAGGVWRAHIWLYEGMNPLAVYAYDEQGNVDVDARLVQCNGAGVGQGSARPLTMAPMPNRTVHVGELVRARCVATSPDSCILTYWAHNVPPGGVFNQELRELTFIPTQAGVAHVIEFFACDGKNVAKTFMTIDVVGGAPPVGIRTKSLPGGYQYYPYTYTLIPDNAVGPVTWSFSDVKPQDGLTISRAGIISGVPLKNGTVNFIAIAQDTRGGATASNVFTLAISKDAPANDIYIPFQQVPVCVSGTAVSALAKLSATNGVPAYTWYDASDALSDFGMALGSNGVIAGTPTKPGVHGWLPVVRDQSNATAHAELALPVIAPEHRLQRMAGLSRAKLLINRVPGSQTKGSVALKMRFTPPAGFTFDQKSPVVAQIGLTQITVPNPFKYTPGAQLVFKKKDGLKSYSISVKYAPGTLQVSCALKKVNLTYDFEQYGIRNENVLAPKTANIPVWVRVGNFEMATELMPLTYTTKAMKSTKGKATF